MRSKNNFRNGKVNVLQRRKTKHISAVLNRAVNKFYIIGDMNHNPMSFHISDIKLHLKGNDRNIALEELCKFLYDERREWILAVYHFFKIDDKIEVVPTVMKLGNTLLQEIADEVEDHIGILKDSVITGEDGFTKENYHFYGYYINYGAHLLMDAMEEDIIKALLQTNNDLKNVNPTIVQCSAEKVLRAIAGEKFSIADKNALLTNLKEVI